MDTKARKTLELVVTEFREGIVHHRAQRATEERIMQILSASIRLAVLEVDDVKLYIWLCDAFIKAAKVAPSPNSQTSSGAGDVVRVIDVF